MKKITAVIITVVAVLALALLPTLASVESDMKNAVGSENSAAEFKLNINAPDTYKAGETVNVSVTVDSITHQGGLTSVEFEFVYDKDKLVLKNEADSENALDCIKKQPNDDWENLTSADRTNGVINCSLLTMGFEESAAKNNGDVTFSFDFEVKSDSVGDIGFYIEHKTVYGSLNVDRTIEDFVGNGGYAVMTEFVNQESSETESSNTENSKEDTSSGVSSEGSENSNASNTSSSAPESSLNSDPESSLSSEPETSVGTSQNSQQSHDSRPEFPWNGNTDDSKPFSPSAWSSDESDAVEEKNGLPDFVIPVMIIGAIVLVIVIAVIVIFALEKKKERDALDEIKDEIENER